MLKDLVKANKTYIEKSNVTSGNKYIVTLKYNNKSISMTYHDNYLNESGKDEFLYALLNDGMSYANCYNLIEFMDEFGYEPDTMKEAKKAYESCKRQLEKLEKLFTREEIEQLIEEFADFWKKTWQTI